MNLGQLALRGVIGPLFVGHGAQKLFGWFGGHGPEGTGGFFESLGLKPGRRHALAAGAAETAGGAMLVLGALTPVAAAAITGTMLTAIRKAHAANGVWTTQGGYEYNAVLIAAMTALADSGPGRPSIDEARFPWMKGPAVAALSLAAGAAGSYLATEVFNQASPADGEREGDAGMAGDPATTDAASGPSADRTEAGRFAAAGDATETSFGEAAPTGTAAS